MFNTTKQLGLYWGASTLCLVEAKGNTVLTAVSIPFDTKLPHALSSDIPENLKFSALIQKTLREHKILSTRINLAVPTKDLIFRSFIIPAMQPNEVKNVVDFEATKYIPIKLEDLIYTYHAIPMAQDQQKSLRILFMAVRKDTLEKYVGILEHSNLQVGNIEPSSVSLSRVLRKHGVVANNQVNAILELGKIDGKIVIVENEVVQSSREFPVVWDTSGESAIRYAKLFNDVRVAFNFYARQNPRSKISKIIVLSLQALPELSQGLSSELNIPVDSITMEKLLKIGTNEDMGLLNAYGVAVRDQAVTTRNFDLSIKTGKAVVDDDKLAEAVDKYKILAFVFTGCVGMIILANVLTTGMVKGFRQELSALEQKQGRFDSSETAQVVEMKTKLSNKLTSYKDIRIKSRVAEYLAKVPQFLIPGTWLRNFEVFYDDDRLTENGFTRTISRIVLSLEGFAYQENPNQQIRLVNSLVSRLKENADFAKSFSSIDLITVKQETLNNFLVTYFKVKCQ